MTNEKLKSFCMSLPGVTEGIKWDDHVCYMVGGKIFCLTSMQDTSPVNFKVSEDVFEELCEREGVMQAPYFARNQWVHVQQRNKLRPKEWEQYLQQAYDLIKSKLTKKLQREIDNMAS